MIKQGKQSLLQIRVSSVTLLWMPQISTNFAKEHFHSLPLDKVGTFDSKYVTVQ